MDRMHWQCLDTVPRLTMFNIDFTMLIATIGVLTLVTTSQASSKDNLLSTDTNSTDNGDIQPLFQFERGSPDRCPQGNLDRLQGLPGYGWDNLRNVEMSTVFETKYYRCRLTTDKKYLIPDDIQVWPQKRSDFHIFSNLFENVSDYKSSMSSSVNLNGGFNQTGASISGSFSFEYENAKSHMIRDDSSTTRTQCRYVFYKVQNDPEVPLAGGLKRRLYDIASAIQSGHTETVRYLAGLLVRDYGTHVVNKVDIGAALVREDQISSSYVEKSSKNKWGITAAAAGSFQKQMKSFNFSIGFAFSSSKEQVDKYEENCTNSDVSSFGGPPIGSDLNLTTWLDGVENNLVTVDRSGDPLWFIVSQTRLPKLPVDTVRDLAQVVQEAVLSYYQHNIYPGCTSIDSPNFSYIANIDDGTCEGPKTNYTFGGMYQSCTGGQCEVTLQQKNPMSGGYSCPSGYTPNLIYERRTVFCKRKCKSFLFIKYGCYDDCGSEYTAHYKAYWCVDTKGVGVESGYMFGGVYTDNVVNPLTQSLSCPAHFSSLLFGTNPRMHVCVSDDYELGFRYSLPFAGFFTCHTGNPLALSSKPLVQLMQSSRGSNDNEPMKLSAYLYQEGPKHWPQKCPPGYSQHLLTVPENGCGIHYCIKTGSFITTKLPTIRRPPFCLKPEVLTNATRLLATSSGKILSRSGEAVEWTAIETQADLDTQMADSGVNFQVSESKDREQMSNTMTAILSVLGTAMFGLIVIMTVIVCRKQGKRRAGILIPPGERHRTYGPMMDEVDETTVMPARV